MKKIGMAFAFFMAFISMSHAQRTNLFDYQVHRMDSINLEIQIQLQQPDHVQFIEVYFLQKGNELNVDVASLNHKRDGKFYLAHNGKEKRIDPSNMSLNFAHDFGLLRGYTVLIKLMDREFNLLDALERTVEY